MKYHEDLKVCEELGGSIILNSPRRHAASDLTFLVMQGILFLRL